jgi:uncharacterized phage protein (TIGR01671 family)
MREIKFRGKTAYGGSEWRYGNLTGAPTHPYIQEVNEVSKDWYNFPRIEVVPDTIGQFTGLQDSKGNDIYEGDILCIKQHELDILRGAFRETEIICVVEFRNGAFIPVMKNGKGYCWSNFIYDKMPTADYTVIGNIHDNQEMMEVAQ